MVKLDLDMNPYALDKAWIEENVSYSQMKIECVDPQSTIFSIEPIHELFNLEFCDIIYEGHNTFCIKEFVKKLDDLKKKILDIVDIDNDDDLANYHISISGAHVYGTGHDGEIEIDNDPSLELICTKPRLETDDEIKARLVLKYRAELVAAQKELKDKKEFDRLKAKYETSSDGTSTKVVK